MTPTAAPSSLPSVRPPHHDRCRDCWRWGNALAHLAAARRLLAGRILSALAGSPPGFSTEELCRQCGNGKGASPAMIEMVLMRLVKQGDVGKVNDRWVSMVREVYP